VHVCGGVDSNMSILGDYIIYDEQEKNWTTLTYKRSKYVKDDAVDVVWKVEGKSMGSFDSDSVLKTSESSPTF